VPHEPAGRQQLVVNGMPVKGMAEPSSYRHRAIWPVLWFSLME
jgi:hypothetical protein